MAASKAQDMVMTTMRRGQMPWEQPYIPPCGIRKSHLDEPDDFNLLDGGRNVEKEEFGRRQWALQAFPGLRSIVKKACFHVELPPGDRPWRVRVDSKHRWVPEEFVWIKEATEAARATFQETLRAHPGKRPRQEDEMTLSDDGSTHADRAPFFSLAMRFSEIATSGEALEIKAIGAVLLEELLWWNVARLKAGDSRDWGPIYFTVPHWVHTVSFYKSAGWLKESERLFRDLWALGRNSPCRYFFDTGDWTRMGYFPFPGTRPLRAPIPPENVLPKDVVSRIRRDWRLLAEEAKALVPMLNGQRDAYPGIVPGRQWQQLVLYDLDRPFFEKTGSGWRENLCTQVPRICGLVRGRMQTEIPGSPAWRLARQEELLGGNDELVGIFGIKGKGWAPDHNGQDARVNVHLCLLNCGQSRLVLGFNQTLEYFDGSLFAFEDRQDHELFNEAEETRVNLVGVRGGLHARNGLGEFPSRARVGVGGGVSCAGECRRSTQHSDAAGMCCLYCSSARPEDLSHCREGEAAARPFAAVGPPCSGGRGRCGDLVEECASR